MLAATGLVSAFQFTLVLPLQSQLPTLLDAPREDTAWVVTSTLLAAAIIMPIAGRLGDMYGKRRVLIALLCTAIAGSVVVALSSGIVWAIVGRALQGAMMGVVPLGISIMRDTLHARRVPSAVALMSSTMGVGGALGMPMSAVMAELADWHLLFWMVASMMTVALALVIWVVPSSVLRTGGRFDAWGALGLACGLLAVMIAVSRGQEWGWLQAPTLITGIGGVLVLLLWGWYQLRTPNALLDLRVAARRPVLLTNLASLALGFALFSSNVVFPQILELPAQTGVGLGLSIMAASLVVMPAGIVMMLVAPLAGAISRRYGPRILLALGASSVVIAYSFTLVLHTAVWHILVANILVGVGIGFGFASMPLLIMQSVPQTETGASNGVNTLFRTLGMTTAGAVVGAVLAASPATYDGVTVPTSSEFTLAFTLGVGAAIVTLVLALCIPPRPDPDRHSALPSEG